MCFSPCFLAATQQAFTQKRLLYCQTCGSQAFHILDCCHKPDYSPVRTSHVRDSIANLMVRVRALVQAWCVKHHRHPVRPTSTAALDLWEARPLVTVDVQQTQPSPEFATADAAEAKPCETSTAHREVLAGAAMVSVAPGAECHKA
jgi:hypothetical protein